ncbi:MAG: deoxyguanosinetriphosphate triphosphohydrolase [Nitrospinae bacterium]|nr:deoxyguanosinetriphosphate triphosphohydrolase [Nitrospinota bacterium]
MVERVKSKKFYEDENLMAYAIKSGDSRGRRYKEEEHPYRSAFQRDRDRIIHSSAFRRLEYKTQVFVYHEGDYYRTRLTHTIEVAQISRSIAKALGVNEVLAEAIALAHDLGHPPFGHSGEKTLDALMKDHGGFEHNKHGLKIVDELEHRYPNFNGLNLTYEVREGIIKHSTVYDHPDHHLLVSDLEMGSSPSLESQIVDYSDGIAYNSHDLDDGITSDMIEAQRLEEIALWKRNIKEIERLHRNIDFKIKKYQVVRMIIDQQVTDLVTQTLKNIERFNIKSVDDIRNRDGYIVSFSKEMEDKNNELKGFLKENLYEHQRVVRMELKAERFITKLFNAYTKSPKTLPPEIYMKVMDNQDNKERLICDYIASMTDRYALDEYKKLFDPYEKV